ncbi:multi-sensor signal transduction multi-kinase [Candidatus Magnetomorum sp. HK-1]|nr:multi-sensor signal transduction multi-kinase [Candidatus Magnetomorum sp. HK-1]
MISFPGYKIIKKNDQNQEYTIFSAKHLQSGNFVTLKFYNILKFSMFNYMNFTREYNNVLNMKSKYIRKPIDFGKIQSQPENGIVLIYKDQPWISAEKYFRNNRNNLKNFLKIAIQFINAMAYVHESGFIYKKITPEHILINPETMEVNLSDYGFYNFIEQEVKDLSSKLKYISPEQTGRMNFSPDYRSDFYSTGISFYELLTGEVPFDFSDPMEIIHAHITRKPVSPNTINSNIPLMISKIIFKLMEKSPENRYQSAFGLKEDFVNCLNQLNLEGAINSFTLAQKDTSIQFRISKKLYGRDKDILKLIHIFESVKKGAKAFTLVSGNPGVGKSSLVYELAQPVMTSGGYFIAGKYDQFQGDIPYNAIIQAFQDMIRKILKDNSSHIETWKKNLINALGTNAQVIIELIPEVEFIIGKQIAVDELSFEKAQNRLNLVFESFIKVFTRKEHPLVLFLDDLQWADPASLSFIKNFLLEYPVKYFYLIGSYRDNELDEYHPFMQTLKSIKRKKGTQFQHVRLNSLSKSDTSILVSDTLSRSIDETKKLSNIIFEKTRGNPFFVDHFLQSLYLDKLVYYDFESGKWRWAIESIKKKDITDNVLSLMSNIIKKLSKNKQDLLKIAACIGNRFDLYTIQELSKQSVSDTIFNMNSLINERLIVLISGPFDSFLEQSLNHQILKITKQKTIKIEPGQIFFEFQHDRIRQTIYSMMPETQQKEFHFSIGQLMLKNTGENDLNENIFSIVNQMNYGVEYISKPDEKNNLIDLNMIAAKKAKTSTAYDAAANYFRFCISILPENKWEELYSSCYNLYMELAECEYLSSNFSKAEEIFNDILKNAKNKIDEAKVYNLKIILYTHIGRLDEAVNIGLKGLSILNMKCLSKPTRITIFLEMIKIRYNRGRRSIDDLLSLPLLKDNEKQVVISLLSHIGTAAFFVNPYLFIYMIVKGVNLSLKYGITGISSFAFIPFGLTLGSISGRYHSGYKYGQLGLKLTEKLNIKEYKAKSYFIFAYFILHWHKHAKENIPYFKLAYQHGLESGDLLFTGHSINNIALYRFILGDNIEEIFLEYMNHKSFMERINDPFIYNDFLDNVQMFLCLKGMTDTPYSLNNKKYDQEKRLVEIRQQGNKLALFMHLLIRLKLLYLFGKYQDCYHLTQELKNIIHIPSGTLYVAEYYFLYSLTLAALYPSVNFRKKILFKVELKKIQKKFKKWSKICPENFLHKYLLISAEIAVIRKNNKKAEKLFQASVKSANLNNYFQNEGIANERAARFYISGSYMEIAKSYIMEARYCYSRWGAVSKIQDLEKTFNKFFPGLHSNKKIQDLDYMTVVNSLQTISTEIIKENLLRKLLKILVKSAGATRVLFISIENGKFCIEAENTTQNTVTIYNSQVKNNDYFLLSAVNYVKRTKKDMLIDDVSREKDFQFNPYAKKHKLKSVLCLPVIRQSKLSAILYFENNIVTGAFTKDRIEVLKLLASQAAISFENATLYDNVIKKEKDLRDVTEKLRSLSTELSLTEERERRRIASDLHDRIGHALANAEMRLVLLKESASAAGQLDVLNEIKGLINQSIKDTHTLTFELSPPILYDLGLEAALDWLIEQTQASHKIHIELQDDMKSKPLSNSQRILLFQSSRELLHNIVKHAKASHVTVSIKRKNDVVYLQITDNGIGFDLSKLNDYSNKKGGFGLFSIQERLKHQGSIFHIKSDYGKGTQITMSADIES